MRDICNDIMRCGALKSMILSKNNFIRMKIYFIRMIKTLYAHDVTTLCG